MNKQIEEMAIALHEAQHEYDKAWHECFQNKGKRPERENVFYAKSLVEKKGYRKQSDTAREIFAELKKAMIDEYRYPVIAELKKKYEVQEDEKNI